LLLRPHDELHADYGHEQVRVVRRFLVFLGWVVYCCLLVMVSHLLMMTSGAMVMTQVFDMWFWLY
jgi:hypothetical protein